jgi:hypothetical protein
MVAEPHPQLTYDLQVDGALHREWEREEGEGVKPLALVLANFTRHLRLQLQKDETRGTGMECKRTRHEAWEHGMQKDET